MKRLIHIIFILLIALVISGVNDFISAKFENQALLSPLVLFLSILVILYFIKNQGSIILSQPAVKLFYVTFFSFLILGGLVGISENNTVGVVKAYRFYLPSIVIFWSGTLGFYNLLITKTFDYILRICRWALLINIAIVLYTFFTNSKLFVVDEVGSEVSGFLLNPNFAGFSANMALAIELYFLRTRSSRLSYFIIPFILLVILIGFSRSALITSIAILLINLLSRSKERKMDGSLKVLIYSILLVVVSGLWFGDLLNKVLETNSYKLDQIQNLLAGEINRKTTGERTFLFSYGWDRIMENPIVGHGIHSFARFQGIGSGVHNQYLLIWGDSGILPLLAYIYLHLYLWLKAGKLHGEKKVLLRSFITAILLFSSTNHTMYANKNYIIVLSLIISTIAYHFMFQEDDSEIGSTRTEGEYTVIESTIN